LAREVAYKLVAPWSLRAIVDTSTGTLTMLPIRGARLLFALGFVFLGCLDLRAESPKFEDTPIFKADKKHNHSSCIIETKSGDLFAVWYAGSGERKSDDVVIQGAW
jgi:hypothetical protein